MSTLPLISRQRQRYFSYHERNTPTATKFPRSRGECGDVKSSLTRDGGLVTTWKTRQACTIMSGHPLADRLQVTTRRGLLAWFERTRERAVAVTYFSGEEILAMSLFRAELTKQIFRMRKKCPFRCLFSAAVGWSEEVPRLSASDDHGAVVLNILVLAGTHHTS